MKCRNEVLCLQVARQMIQTYKNSLYGSPSWSSFLRSLAQPGQPGWYTFSCPCRSSNGEVTPPSSSSIVRTYSGGFSQKKRGTSAESPAQVNAHARTQDIGDGY